jgi:superfamily I DNA/RNA helicase
VRFKLPPISPSGSIVWSDEQEAIFDWFVNGWGNLLVRARAGTGKTTTLLEGVQRAPEKRACVAAFNKSIADELQTRIRASNVRAQTLHSLGFGIIRKWVPSVKVDNDARKHVLAVAATKQLLGEGSGQQAPDAILGIVAAMHTKIREILGDPRAIWPEDRAQLEIFDWLMDYDASWFDTLEDHAFWNSERVAEAAFLAVQLALGPTEIIDFADMIFLPVALDWAQPRFDLLVVDEAQDMSPLQLELAQRVCRGRFALVGDDRQTIYGFRGADVGCLDRLKEELHAQELGLTTTYRCPQSVVRLARQYVCDINCPDDAPEGTARDWATEAMLLDQAQPGDFVLSRSNAPLAVLYFKLIRSGKSAYVKGRDMSARALQIVRKLAKGKSEMDIGELPEALEAWRVARHKKIAAKSKDPLKAAARKAKIDDDCMVVTAFIEGSTSYPDLIRRLNQSGSGDNQPVRDDAIMLSTVHKAKGLEAKTVWLVGPSFFGSVDEDSEESNICYVAVTRSKDRLFLLDASWDRFLHPRPAWLEPDSEFVWVDGIDN